MRTHYTHGYRFPDSGEIEFVTVCGKYRRSRKDKVHATVLPEAVNCKKCREIISKRNII